MQEKKQTILEWYQRTQKQIDASCNGKGECGRCKIKFLEHAPAASWKDVKLLSPKELEEGIRLACTAEKTEAENFIPMTSFLQQDMFVPNLYQKQEKEAFEEESKFGIALDIGTTTLAMSLVELHTGVCISTVTRVNHQRSYGSDVLSRILSANEGNLMELQHRIKQDILAMLLDIRREAKIELSKIQKLVVVGNTTMCHLLRGLSCEGLGKAPFCPVSIEFVKMEMKELFSFEDYRGMNQEIQKEFLEQLTGQVIILPAISAFVGADIAAGIYACDMDLKEEIQMLIDVGTNGELVIGNKDGFWVTSAAAGPVFEGGNISCGIPAVTGAISKVRCSSIEENTWEYQVLGTEETIPQGFCGSGLIDFVSELLQIGIIDENGTLNDRYFESGFRLPVKELEEGKQIRLLQSDIRQLQMGKAAIRAGIEILIRKMGTNPNNSYLSGGFGTAMDKESAGTIGLFPKDCFKQIASVGNTALAGARKYLLDENGEERLNQIVQLSKELYLAKEPDFEEKYILFMQFLV